MDEIILTFKGLSAMSRLKGRSSLHEARYTAQLIYLIICVGLPNVYIHVMAFITTADILLMCGGFLPALPTPVTDYTIARNILISASSCLRRYPCSVMMACFTRLQII